MNKYDIIGVGACLDNEYEREAIEITNRVQILSEDKLAQYIRQVFKFWFGEDLLPTNDSIFKLMAIEIKMICPEE